MYPYSFRLGKFDTHKKLAKAIDSLQRMNRGFYGVENIREALATKFERMLWYVKIKNIKHVYKKVFIQIVSKI